MIIRKILEVFQRPERASFISTSKVVKILAVIFTVFQRPERASFISTAVTYGIGVAILFSFNALNGLLSFLRYPLGTRINTGFPVSFLQVFV